MSKQNDKPRTNTAAKIVAQNGKCFGILHAHKLTGYKAKNAYGSFAAFPKASTYKDAFKPSYRFSSNSSSGSPYPAKDLVPYDPDALRSRLPVDIGNESKPCVRFCKPRNVSGFEIRDPNLGHTDENRFKTISASFFLKLTPNQSSGNMGIMAEKAKRARRKIWD